MESGYSGSPDQSFKYYPDDNLGPIDESSTPTNGEMGLGTFGQRGPPPPVPVRQDSISSATLLLPTGRPGEYYLQLPTDVKLRFYSSHVFTFRRFSSFFFYYEENVSTSTNITHSAYSYFNDILRRTLRQ